MKKINQPQKNFKDDEYQPYVDPAFRRPVQVIYNKPPKCPADGMELELVSVKPHWFPYIHVDTMMTCPVCTTNYTFGIPMSKDAGLSLHVFDTNPVDTVSRFRDFGPRICAWKQHGKMLPTKIFGDWLPYSEKLEYQWKCPTCFLVQHEEYDRICPHGDRMTEPEPPLSKEEQEALENRLRALGYIE